MNYVKSNRDVTAAILRYFNPIGNHKSGLIGMILKIIKII